MCLKHISEKKIASKDIICYKVIIKFVTIEGINFYTPYRCFIVEIGKEYNSPLCKKDNEVYTGLHSFRKLKDAENEILSNWDPRRLRIARCIIPEGSEYYEGGFNTHSDAYASNKIKYIKIV